MVFARRSRSAEKECVVPSRRPSGSVTKRCGQSFSSDSRQDESETTRSSFGLKGEATVTLNKGSRVLEVLVDR